MSNLNPVVNLMTISQAARSLEISVKTLRRWEALGLISPSRNPLNHRLYHPGQIRPLIGRKNQPLSSVRAGSSKLYTISQAARMIGISVKTLRRWDQTGKISCTRNLRGQRCFTSGAITQAKKIKLMQDRLLVPVSRRRPGILTPAAYGLGLILTFTLGGLISAFTFNPVSPIPRSQNTAAVIPYPVSALFFKQAYAAFNYQSLVASHQEIALNTVLTSAELLHLTADYAPEVKTDPGIVEPPLLTHALPQLPVPTHTPINQADLDFSQLGRYSANPDGFTPLPLTDN